MPLSMNYPLPYLDLEILFLTFLVLLIIYQLIFSLPMVSIKQYHHLDLFQIPLLNVIILFDFN